MNRACGNKDAPSTALRGIGLSGRTVAHILAALAVAGGLALATGASAAGAAPPYPPKPKPEALWRAYPLNPADARRRAVAEQPRSGGNAVTPSKPSSKSGADSSWILWLATSAGVLAVLVGAFALSRRVPLSLPSARASSRAVIGQARERMGAVTEAVSHRAGAAAAAPRRLRPALTERARSVPRPNVRRLSVPTATAARALTETLMYSVRTVVQPRQAQATLVEPQPVPPRVAPPARAQEQEVLKRKAATGEPVEPQPVPPRVAPPARAQEQEVLKRKAAKAEPDSTTKLKAKAHAATSQPVHEQRDLTVLKAKLADRPRESPPVRSDPRPMRVGGSSVRIGWWRGYVKSQFDARLRRPAGEESVLLTSPPFRWSKPTPPPEDLPQVAHAHTALVAQLEQRGWVVTGRGEHWYALELERRSDSPRTAGAQEGGT